MRNPNGFGNISKLSGNRRNPFRVRVTAGWKLVDRLTEEVIEELPEGADPFETLSDGKLRYKERQVFNTVGYI